MLCFYSCSNLVLFWREISWPGLRQQPPPHTFSSTPFANGIPKGGTSRVHHGKWLILRTFQCNDWDFIHSSPWTLHCPSLTQWFPRESRETSSIPPATASPPRGWPGHCLGSGKRASSKRFQTPRAVFTHPQPQVKDLTALPSPPTFPILNCFLRAIRMISSANASSWTWSHEMSP